MPAPPAGARRSLAAVAIATLLLAAPRGVGAQEREEEGFDLAEDLLGPLIERVSSISLSEAPGLSDFGDLTDRFVIYLAGKPWRITERKIDRLVEEPRTLKRTTAASVDSFGSIAWVELGSSLALDLPNLRHDFGATMPGVHPAGLRGASIVLDEEQATRVMEGVLGRLHGYFRVDELVDLGVFTMWQVTTFPETPAQWRVVKRVIMTGDAWLALASVAGLASQDRAFVSASGWVVRIAHDRLRMGWYAGARDVGFSWHPTARGGVKVAAPGLDVSAGLRQRTAAVGTVDDLSVELAAREHLLAYLGRSRGWDLAASAGGRVVLRHELVEEEGRLLGQARLFGRKKGLLPSFDLFVDGSYLRDIGRDDAIEASIGLMHPRTGIAGVLSVAAERHSDDGPRVGVLIAGPLGGGVDLHEAISASGHRLAEALEAQRALEARICEDRAPGASEETARRGTLETQLALAHDELTLALDAYVVQRDRAYGARSDDAVGPVGRDDLSFARTRLRAWPALAVVCWPRP